MNEVKGLALNARQLPYCLSDAISQFDLLQTSGSFGGNRHIGAGKSFEITNTSSVGPDTLAPLLAKNPFGDRKHIGLGQSLASKAPQTAPGSKHDFLNQLLPSLIIDAAVKLPQIIRDHRP